MKVKVVKVGVIKRRTGFLLKKFKVFESFLLQNGLILFYQQLKGTTEKEEAIKMRI